MNRPGTCGEFRCAHCGYIVSNAHLLSSVNHRNHCPYCLWSRHLDLYTAGDTPLEEYTSTRFRQAQPSGSAHRSGLLDHREQLKAS